MPNAEKNKNKIDVHLITIVSPSKKLILFHLVKFVYRLPCDSISISNSFQRKFIFIVNAFHSVQCFFSQRHFFFMLTVYSVLSDARTFDSVQMLPLELVEINFYFSPIDSCCSSYFSFLFFLSHSPFVHWLLYSCPFKMNYFVNLTLKYQFRVYRLFAYCILYSSMYDIWDVYY